MRPQVSYVVNKIVVKWCSREKHNFWLNIVLRYQYRAGMEFSITMVVYAFSVSTNSFRPKVLL